MKSAYTFLAVLACAGGVSPASAQEGRREHDGFMLRLTAGLGYGSMSTELVGTTGLPSSLLDAEFKLAGVAGAFAVDVGGSPVANLVLHGRFSFLSLVSPTLSVNGDDLGGIDDDTAVSMYLLAPAVTYYFMPVNIYLSGAAGLAFAGIIYDDGDDRERGSTDLGWGLNLDAGMEFWVGSSWGLGPALRFFYISVPDDTDRDDSPVWHGLGFAALFSGTFQ